MTLAPGFRGAFRIRHFGIVSHLGGRRIDRLRSAIGQFIRGGFRLCGQLFAFGGIGGFAVLAALILLIAGLPILAGGQQPSPATSTPEQQGGSAAAPDEGIPVTDADVVKACGSCHVRDEKQRMTRISYRRATPENWELTIRRMISLNKAR